MRDAWRQLQRWWPCRRTHRLAPGYFTFHSTPGTYGFHARIEGDAAVVRAADFLELPQPTTRASMRQTTRYEVQNVTYRHEHWSADVTFAPRQRGLVRIDRLLEGR